MSRPTSIRSMNLTLFQHTKKPLPNGYLPRQVQDKNDPSKFYGIIPAIPSVNDFNEPDHQHLTITCDQPMKVMFESMIGYTNLTSLDMTIDESCYTEDVYFTHFPYCLPPTLQNLKIWFATTDSPLEQYDPERPLEQMLKWARVQKFLEFLLHCAGVTLVNLKKLSIEGFVIFSRSIAKEEWALLGRLEEFVFHTFGGADSFVRGLLTNWQRNPSLKRISLGMELNEAAFLEFLAFPRELALKFDYLVVKDYPADVAKFLEFFSKFRALKALHITFTKLTIGDLFWALSLLPKLTHLTIELLQTEPITEHDMNIWYECQSYDIAFTSIKVLNLFWYNAQFDWPLFFAFPSLQYCSAEFWIDPNKRNLQQFYKIDVFIVRRFFKSYCPHLKSAEVDEITKKKPKVVRGIEGLAAGAAFTF